MDYTDAVETARSMGIFDVDPRSVFTIQVDMRGLANFDWELRCKPTIDGVKASYVTEPVHGPADGPSVDWHAVNRNGPPPVVTFHDGKYTLLDGAHRLAVHFCMTGSYMATVRVI